LLEITHLRRLHYGRLSDLGLGQVDRRSVLRLGVGILLVEKLVSKVVVSHLARLVASFARFLTHFIGREEVLSLLKSHGRPHLLRALSVTLSAVVLNHRVSWNVLKSHSIATIGQAVTRLLALSTAGVSLAGDHLLLLSGCL
jgi:hypothetical protein